MININCVPLVSRTQMIEVDRLMIEEFGISLLQMMENAGRNLADLAQSLLGGYLSHKSVVVFCGGGSNCGGGLAAARHLINRGADVWVALAVGKLKMKAVPATQLSALDRMGAHISSDFPKGDFNLIIDALIGYGLRGSPRGNVADWITRINQLESRVLSLDIPSGMDADKGKAAGACVCASQTMTLALPKIGMRSDSAKNLLGDLYLADISVPEKLLHSLGIETKALFDEGAILRLMYD